MAKISIYDRLEDNFTHNGTVLSDTIYCTVEEELNGMYQLELTHPISVDGKWRDLVEENIIKADGQLFRIHSTEKDLNYVYVYARHIFYDLIHNFLEDVRPTNLNGSGALNWILQGTQYPHNFIGMSDIDTLNTQYYIRKNPVESMLGPDSLVTRWNGELVRDNYTIRLLRQRGQNKGSQIAYGKNMLGLEVKKDMDTVITRIMPIGRDGLLLPEKYVDSPLIGNYTFPHIRKVDFDVGVEENTTEEEAFQKLREGANNLYEINKVDVPYVNIIANLLLLENTEEYKHLKSLVKVELGDIVSCTDNPLNITFESKVIGIKKDVLSNRNVEVELGQFRKGISNTIQNAINEISEEIKHNKSDLEKAIENATELLTNALGGYVTKRPGEILIMDTEDINTATEVWRWNLNGLGYSGTGINGPYRLAITMDGKINADFIITGTLNAGIVKTGILASKDNSIWINLDSNNFNFKDQLIWDGQQDKLILGEKTIISWDSVDNKPWIPQNAEDIGAKPDDWAPTWAEIQEKPTILSANDIKTTVITKDWIGTLGLLVGSEIQMGANAKISWSNVTDQPTILTSTNVTTITSDTISTTNVVAQNLKVKSANIEGLITADSLKTTASINVGTDATIGNILYLGNQTNTTLKGVYFSNNSSITNTSNKMSIYASRGFDIYSNNGSLSIGTRYNSGFNTIVTGAGISIDTTSSTSSGAITIACRYNYGPISFKHGTTTVMEILYNGVDFKNLTPKNLSYNPNYVVDKNNSRYPLEFRNVSGELQYKNSDSGTWLSPPRPTAVEDRANTRYGIEFRYYGSKLQYKRTNSSTWIDII